MKVHQVIHRPLQTEKSMIGRDQYNLATFAVDRRANKLEIKQAVEQLFDVQVKRVRTMQQQGKKRRVGRIIGRKPAWKKAIVELADGFALVILDASSSDDGEGGTEDLDFRWEKISGPAGDNIGRPNKESTAINFTQPGEYIYEVRVSDDSGEDTARAEVRVEGPPEAAFRRGDSNGD